MAKYRFPKLKASQARGITEAIETKKQSDIAQQEADIAAGKDVSPGAPWRGVQPFLMDYLRGTQDWYEGGPSLYQAPTPEMQTAMDMMSQRAMMGSPITQAAQMEGLRTLSGQGMFNPLYEQAAQRLGETFQNITIPTIQSQFGRAGRTGSGLYQQMAQGAMGNLGRSLSDLSAQAYGQERGRQMQMMGMAPQLAQMDYGDIGQLMNVGQMRRGFQQEAAGAPLQRLQQYGGMFSPATGYAIGAPPAQMPQLQPGSNLLQGAGLGMMAYGAFGNPYAAAAGFALPFAADAFGI
jgi:hypothetical protein